MSHQEINYFEKHKYQFTSDIICQFDNKAEVLDSDNSSGNYPSYVNVVIGEEGFREI